ADRSDAGAAHQAVSIEKELPGAELDRMPVPLGSRQSVGPASRAGPEPSARDTAAVPLGSRHLRRSAEPRRTRAVSLECACPGAARLAAPTPLLVTPAMRHG